MATTPRPGKAPTDHLPKKKTAVKKTDEQKKADEDGFWTGELAGTEIRVLPMAKWKISSLSALRAMDLERWADGAVHPDDRELFAALDPTVGDSVRLIADVTVWLKDQDPAQMLNG